MCTAITKTVQTIPCLLADFERDFWYRAHPYCFLLVAGLIAFPSSTALSVGSSKVGVRHSFVLPHDPPQLL